MSRGRSPIRWTNIVEETRSLPTRSNTVGLQQRNFGKKINTKNLNNQLWRQWNNRRRKEVRDSVSTYGFVNFIEASRSLLAWQNCSWQWTYNKENFHLNSHDCNIITPLSTSGSCHNHIACTKSTFLYDTVNIKCTYYTKWPFNRPNIAPYYTKS